MFICEVMKRGCIKLAGLSFSGPLLEFPDAAVRIEAELYKRKQDFKQLRSSHICYSPHYEKGNLCTYWACFEVEESAAVPPGIISFEVPEQKYAKVICNGNSIGEAYQWILNGSRKMVVNVSQTPTRLNVIIKAQIMMLSKKR